MAPTGRFKYRVDGLSELLFVTDRLSKGAAKAVRKELRTVAAPLRDAAQRNYEIEIGPDSKGRLHSKYGISIRKTGVIAVEQRIKSINPKVSKFRRPKFNELQWNEALGPARDDLVDEMDHALENAFDRLRREWVSG